MNEIPAIQKIISVLWPSFLTSSIANAVFFTTFDPQELLLPLDMEFSRLGAYTIGFFLFWCLTSVTCALTCYFQRPCNDPRGES